MPRLGLWRLSVCKEAEAPDLHLGSAVQWAMARPNSSKRCVLGNQDISMHVAMRSSNIFQVRDRRRWANIRYCHSLGHHHLIDSMTSSWCKPIHDRTDNEFLGNGYVMAMANTLWQGAKALHTITPESNRCWVPKHWILLLSMSLSHLDLNDHTKTCHWQARHIGEAVLWCRGTLHCTAPAFQLLEILGLRSLHHMHLPDIP